MDNPKILIKRSKEELRRYNLFSAIEQRPIRRILNFAGPFLGLLQFAIYILWVPNPINLLIGVFLTLYPFIIRFSVIRASDRAFEQGKLQDYEVYITFNEDNFISETDVVCQKIMYPEVYKVFNRRDDLIIYIGKYSGLYISKASYSEDTVTRIIDILKKAIPEKF